MEILKPRAVLALGKIAWDGYLETLKHRGVIASRALYKFAHGAEAEVTAGAPRLFGVYHPSQQNTFTGKLTTTMLDDIFTEAKKLAELSR